jgi:F-type H+-transporting ATPase subunit a
VTTVLAKSDVPWPPSVEDIFTPGFGDSVWLTKFPLMIWLAVALLIVLFVLAVRNSKLVPSRGQWLAESAYGFVREGIAKEIIGAQGARFAPYLATLFLFVLVTNLFGVVPFLQVSPNVHIAFPATLAVLTYVLYHYLGIKRHGFGKYVKNALFPPGMPPLLYIILTPLEFFQVFVTQPLTLAVRLFANMFAGHLILLVFTLGGFVLLGAGNIGLAAVGVVSFGFAIIMTVFELVVAVLQAYVFAVLTAVYFGNAIADEH